MNQNPVAVPVEKIEHPVKDVPNKEALCSLMCLATTTRPDLAFAVSVVLNS